MASSRPPYHDRVRDRTVPDADGLLDALTEVSRALLDGAEPLSVLSLIARRAAELVGAESAAIMVPDVDRQMLQIVAAHGPLADEVMSLTYLVAGSVSGLAFTSGTVQVMEEARADARVAHHWAGQFETGPAAIAPLVGGAEPLGVISVVNGHGEAPFTPADVLLIESFAGQAALTLELAHTRDELERLRVLEDRERIARDLHDSVIQRLYAAGMMIESVAGEPGSAEIEHRLRGAVDEIDTTIKEIRSTIFDLGAGGDGHPSLRAEVLALVHDAAARGGWEPRVMFIGPVDDPPRAAWVGDLVASVRELLSNAVRHSGAEKVVLEIAASPSSLTLRVKDDGSGIAESATRHSGLDNVTRRAELLGGRCVVTTAAGMGTTVEWTIPTMIRSGSESSRRAGGGRRRPQLACGAPYRASRARSTRSS